MENLDARAAVARHAPSLAANSISGEAYVSALLLSLDRHSHSSLSAATSLPVVVYAGCLFHFCGLTKFLRPLLVLRCFTHIAPYIITIIQPNKHCQAARCYFSFAVYGR